jgi:NAD(P)-dependent dehydrogenase (short-subunit alcohol dehydrogenase family)
MQGRVAVVTGGASGIGCATVERLARDGTRVVVIDRVESEPLTETVRGGGGGWDILADVGDAAQVQQAFDAVMARRSGSTC